MKQIQIKENPFAEIKENPLPDSILNYQSLDAYEM